MILRREQIPEHLLEYFEPADWNAEEVDPFFYCAKAGKLERSAGCEALPQLCIMQDRREEVLKTNELTARLATAPQGNHHPTVKPLRLTRYLASLLLPPDDYAPRRLFVPFAGSGSEMIGGILAGWESVTGVEMTPEYVDIARARLAFWQGNVGLFEALTAEAEESEPEQLGMEL